MVEIDEESSVMVRVVVCAGDDAVFVQVTVSVFWGVVDALAVTVSTIVVGAAVGSVPSEPLPSTLTTEYDCGDLLCLESAIGCAEAIMEQEANTSIDEVRMV